MKRKLLFIISVLLVLIGVISIKNNRISSKNDTIEISVRELRNKHKNFLKNSPYKLTRDLSKKERKALGLPPNAFFEQEWERTLDPNLGYPNIRGALKIQHELIEANKNRSFQLGVPGQDIDNAWIERGPNNVGGRTRGILFDPNDPSNERVFAGGVSGGLWVNNNITDANSVWQLVSGVPENIAVNVFAVDPNNSNIIYLASGEQFTGGDAVGNGVYRSIDGGINWEMIFGGPEGTANTPNGVNFVVDGVFYVNDIITRDVGGNTEVYFSATNGIFFDGFPAAFLGPNQRGVYRSLDNGDSWTLLSINQNGGNQINPNDLELDTNNNIWVSTTSSNGFSTSPGGEIFMSTDGVNFNFVNSIANAARTEIEASQQNPNLFYIAANVNGQADIFITTDAFETIQSLNEPNDANNSIPPNDYARNQAFYDLPIEVDPNDDTILYIGGINLFRGTVNLANVSVNWDQISRDNANVSGSQSLVHADQHAIVFRPGNSNQAVFGNDGGVFFGTDLVNANTSATILRRNNGYAVTQFYAGDINDVDGTSGGGTQDNGSPFNLTGDSSNGVESYFAVIGGDGAYGQFDDDGDYFIASTQFINYFFINTPINGVTNEVGIQGIPTVAATGFNITDRNGGNFINEADVDTNLDILYINARTGGQNSINQIGRYTNLEQGPNAIVETIITDQLLVSNISSFKVSPYTLSSTRLLIGTDEGVLLNVDDADTSADFSDITGSSFVGSISDIEFGINSQSIMITMSNYGVENLWYTEDNGETWLSKEGDLPDIPVFTILQSPLNPNEVIIGTQFGVWRTNNFLDANPNWQQSFNGMSNVPVRDLDLRPSTNEVLASTYGRGMFIGLFTQDPDEDNDGDGIPNNIDNCPNTPNPDQADIDGNGIGDVCQDTDNDGILDINDNCPNNENIDQLDSDGDGMGDVCDIPQLNDQDNIRVQTISETCPGLNNGVIDINVLATDFSYEANVNGEGVDRNQTFSFNTSFNDLPVGSYIVTISVASENFERVFEINIDEAPPLDIDFEGVLPSTNPNSEIYRFNVNEGTGPYEIRFNNELLRITSDPNIEIEIEGSGTLEIISSRLCEGVFSLEIDGPNRSVIDILAFPNPVVNQLMITIPGDADSVPVSIYNITGQLVYQENSIVSSNTITLPFQEMPNGIYFVRLEMEEPVTLKIIK